MDERRIRLWAAAEAKALGRGGVRAVTKATGIRSKRICIGKRELTEMDREPPEQPAHEQRVRRPSAGRKPLLEKDPTLLADLDSLLHSAESVRSPEFCLQDLRATS